MRKFVLYFLLLIIGLIIIFGSCRKKTSTSIDLTSVDFGTATNTPTKTITPTPVVWNTTKLIDDMETIASSGVPGPDNANAIPESEGGPGYWYTYDDIKDVLISPDGDRNTSNASYVWPMSATRWTIVLGNPKPEPTFEMSERGDFAGGYAARITGYVTTAYKNGFAGMGVNLLRVNPDNSKKPVDISGMTGVRFGVKGDGKDYRIKLLSQNPLFDRGESDDHYGYQFITRPWWGLVTIPLNDFTQEGWGSKVPRSEAMKYIDSIQFQTVGQPKVDEPPLSFDLWVDNLEIYK